jgi:chemotaxis protein methyltransferase CheR
MNIFDHDIKRLGQFDFVFSRNMIIYFDKKSRLEAEKALVSLLKPGGILFLGHADIVQNSFNLEKTVVGGIVYYKKEQ